MSRILPDYNQLMRFTINDVCNWLAENRFGEFVKQFREHGIDGNRFVTLSDLDLSRMNCPMAKRRDLLKLVRELPKPAESSRMKNIVQPQIPATPSRDYNPPNHGRPPPPIPAPQAQVNGDNNDDDDGSGPEDDYEWGASDFSDVSSEEEIQIQKVRLTANGTQNSIHLRKRIMKTHQIASQPIVEPRRPTQQPPDEDTDSVGSYEEPDPQSAPPPPSVPTRRGAPQVAPSGPPRSASHGVPVNRRPVPQMPPEEEQPVYEDPDEQPVKKPAPRRQLPVPEQTSTMGRKMPMRTTSEPDAPAPPPPRGKGRQPPKAVKKAEESPAPVPPPLEGAEDLLLNLRKRNFMRTQITHLRLDVKHQDLKYLHLKMILNRLDDYEKPVEVSHPPSQGHKSSICPLPGETHMRKSLNRLLNVSNFASY
ncbi:unnamed protein product [Mytilus edulis]|uniref:SAM domain-containing protein n=1 Tax=Mytilus edulis TaxID=6550 RepID=A0A8S3Q0Q8_MYTED|nr:unnamed protein product [Mytilus edulis]